ncbi:MAG: HD domain-containing protein [Ruminiclostridium sp.]|nr:HD domain-containing protein [Ruminiclostridium sp.]
MDIENKVIQEFNTHLMHDKKPSLYFNEKEREGLFSTDYPFTLLGALKKTEQNPKYHPEGNCWNHTMQVVDNAAVYKGESSAPEVFMWSSLLHDIGKPSTTKVRRGKITAYDHDKVGEKLAADFLEFYKLEKNFIRNVCKLVRWHMQFLMVIKELPFADIKTMKEEVDLNEIALLSLCDRLGRGDITEESINEEKKNIQLFLKKCGANAKD